MRSFELDHVCSALYDCPWAIVPERLGELHAILRRRLDAVPAVDAIESAKKKAKKRLEAAEPEKGPRAEIRNVVGLPVRQYGKVAVMPLYGVVSQRMSWLTQYSGGTSTEQFGKCFDQLCLDKGTRAIVMDVDSPGGSVSGVQELAAKILGARDDKKCYAICNGMMASAAYWIGSAAQECWITPSGMAGSIGVYSMHEDMSGANEEEGRKVTYISAGKYKTEGNPDEPLNDEARNAMQAVVDAYYDAFVKAVAKQRGTTEAAVRSGYGEGRVLTAGKAVSEKLVDRIGTLEQLLGRLGAETGSGSSASASVAQAELALADS